MEAPLFSISTQEKISKLITKYLNSFSKQEQNYILVGLKVFADLDYVLDSNEGVISLDLFQKSLSKINEKEQRLKNTGVYFTPSDVTQYIVANTFLHYLFPKNNLIDSYCSCKNSILNGNYKRIISASIFDPTCGTAEFLLTALELKFELCSNINDRIVIQIVSSIYGNDIALESLYLSKIRLFFAAVSRLSNKSNAIKIAKMLEKNFTTEDYVIHTPLEPRYDIIVGNPPYAEYSKVAIKPSNNFGNIYADVLSNAIDSLNDNGCISFVIPISFVSTNRMSRIREIVFSKLGYLFVLNYADRPDCLFDGVHQKLTILVGVKCNKKCEIFSSSYIRWYTQEREQIFNFCNVFPVTSTIRYIPKIGNDIEWNIFEKIKSVKGVSLLHTLTECEEPNTYLNMRGCFWIKAFSFNPGSNEYKSFSTSSTLNAYILSVLNSSLFFFYWTAVSDCWHITNNDLAEFIIPTENVETENFKMLYEQLEEKLESTKRYIGSKQVEYEYKHRECKFIIDKIDDILGEVYHLTKIEVEYLKVFELKYRMSNGEV